MHPGTHASALQTVPAAQSLLARQATQEKLVVSHRGVGAEQSLSTWQATQTLVAMSQTVPVGHVLAASQPCAQTFPAQRWPGEQSAEVRHATHDVCALHFWPVGQSAFMPQTTHDPPRHTKPVVDVAQSAFDVHPANGASSLLVVSGNEVTSLPVDASTAGPTSGAPPAEHPDGKKAMVASRVQRAKQTRERRSRTT